MKKYLSLVLLLVFFSLSFGGTQKLILDKKRDKSTLTIEVQKIKTVPLEIFSSEDKLLVDLNSVPEKNSLLNKEYKLSITNSLDNIKKDVSKKNKIKVNNKIPFEINGNEITFENKNLSKEVFLIISDKKNMIKKIYRGKLNTISSSAIADEVPKKIINVFLYNIPKNGFGGGKISFNEDGTYQASGIKSDLEIERVDNHEGFLNLKDLPNMQSIHLKTTGAAPDIMKPKNGSSQLARFIGVPEDEAGLLYDRDGTLTLQFVKLNVGYNNYYNNYNNQIKNYKNILENNPHLSQADRENYLKLIADLELKIKEISERRYTVNLRNFDLGIDYYINYYLSVGDKPNITPPTVEVPPEVTEGVLKYTNDYDLKKPKYVIFDGALGSLTGIIPSGIFPPKLSDVKPDTSATITFGQSKYVFKQVGTSVPNYFASLSSNTGIRGNIQWKNGFIGFQLTSWTNPAEELLIIEYVKAYKENGVAKEQKVTHKILIQVPGKNFVTGRGVLDFGNVYVGQKNITARSNVELEYEDGSLNVEYSLTGVEGDNFSNDNILDFDLISGQNKLPVRVSIGAEQKVTDTKRYVPIEGFISDTKNINVGKYEKELFLQIRIKE